MKSLLQLFLSHLARGQRNMQGETIIAAALDSHSAAETLSPVPDRRQPEAEYNIVTADAIVADRQMISAIELLQQQIDSPTFAMLETVSGKFFNCAQQDILLYRQRVCFQVGNKSDIEIGRPTDLIYERIQSIVISPVVTLLHRTNRTSKIGETLASLLLRQFDFGLGKSDRGWFLR